MIYLNISNPYFFWGVGEGVTIFLPTLPLLSMQRLRKSPDSCKLIFIHPLHFLMPWTGLLLPSRATFVPGDCFVCPAPGERREEEAFVCRAGQTAEVMSVKSQNEIC